MENINQFLFEGKRITVFGLGVSGGGVGTVEFLVRRGAKEIIVTDVKNESELFESVEKIRSLRGVRFSLGEQKKEDFTGVDMVIKNPRIPWTNEYICMARDANVPVEMDSSVFFALCDKPIIGVTGTKGKSTTASFIAHLLRASGKNALEIGIGEVPVLSLFEKVSLCDVVVFELSSWRLSALSNIQKSPHIAVFTTFYPDHLNYYASMKDYFDDKLNIVRFQTHDDVFVYNAENEQLVREAGRVISRRVFFSNGEWDGDGSFVRNGNIIFREDGLETIVAPISNLHLLGRHNIGNMLAAVAATRAFGIDFESLSAGILSFAGVQHRLEFIAQKFGGLWYNDSSATIPDATIASIESFKKPIILLAGGSDKNLNFNTLGQCISESEYVKGVVLFSGDASEKIAESIRKSQGERKILATVSSMKDAVEEALSHMGSGNVILLSPGAASFGLFVNEFDRGNQFREIVKSL